MKAGRRRQIILWGMVACFLATVRLGLSVEIVLSEETQLRVADVFMEEKEYYRAVTEYKRYLILFPDAMRADYAQWQIGKAFYEGEEYEKAVKSFIDLQTKFSRSEYIPSAIYYQGLSYWRLRHYESARITLKNLADSYPDSPYAPLALATVSLVALDAEDSASTRAALSTLGALYPVDAGILGVSKAMRLLEEYDAIPRKSPFLAGLMSAVLPGAGYFYAERYGDGIMAFVINGLSVAGALSAVYNENYALAGIVGGIGAPFYLGSIYGSANAARKWNAAIRNDYRNRIQMTLEVPF